MTNDIDQLVTVRQILEFLPVSAGTWRAGVKSGIYPVGVKISERKTVWRKSDIQALILSYSAK